MDDLLTLPGSIPGLLRRGSPVVYRNDALNATGWGNVLPTPEEDECGGRLTFWAGAIDAPENAGQRMIDALSAGMGANPGRGVYVVPTFLLALDLTDATGRAHAAWWLAGEAKWWPAEPNYTTAIWRRWNFDPATTGGCRIGIGPSHWWPWSHEALATIDPNDPRLLPDGSRWVDAEALRLVCLHVAGLGVTRV